MSEFKGTKGIWTIEGSYDISTTEGVPVLDCGCGCCSYHSVQKADLQLMSKAPQMLEMLIQLKDTLSDGRTFGYNDYDRVECLIKEATELK